VTATAHAQGQGPAIVRRLSYTAGMSKSERDPPSVMLTVRVPGPVAGAIDARASKEGVGRSDVVRTLLALGLRSAGSVEAEVAALRREVHSLRKDIAALRGKRR